MKYLVETLSTFRLVYVVEADSEEEAFAACENSDDNWQDWLGQTKLDVRVFSEDQVEHFKSKNQYFWNGYTSVKNGEIVYHYPDGTERKA